MIPLHGRRNNGSSNPMVAHGGKNFLSSSDVFQDAASCDLTLNNACIIELQRLLYQREDIMLDSIGRWGVMRPTDRPSSSSHRRMENSKQLVALRSKSLNRTTGFV
ncbi:hypothetical protein ACA910_007114 [Epithemia clementina (nom. ined.)]